MTQLDTAQAIEQLRAGRQIVLIDDEDRENEGDLCMIAEKVTAADINFMARFGRGLICLTLTPERVAKLGLAKMSHRNESQFGTDFYVSIEAREGVTTGISAADRATTIRVAVSPDATPQSVVSPGHVFPICAKPGGVLVRCGQTEGSVDLARLAGCEPAGIICEIMNDDGTMARRPELLAFAKQHDLGVLTIAQLVEYRLQRERLIEECARATVVPAGLSKPFQLIAYRSAVSDAQYLALVLGDVARATPVLVRVHRAVLPSDLFGMAHPGDPGEPDKNRIALRLIEKAGAGVFIYVLPATIDVKAHVSALANPKAAPAAQKPDAQKHANAELREFGLGAQVLHHLGVHKVTLLTDHPRRIVGLAGFSLEVVGTQPITL